MKARKHVLAAALAIAMVCAAVAPAVLFKGGSADAAVYNPNSGGGCSANCTFTGTTNIANLSYGTGSISPFTTVTSPKCTSANPTDTGWQWGPNSAGHTLVIYCGGGVAAYGYHMQVGANVGDYLCYHDGTDFPNSGVGSAIHTCDGTDMFNGTMHASGLTAVAGTALCTDGSKGIVDTGCAASGTLAGLTDVKVTSPSNAQVLTYNSTDAKWENQAASGGGSGSGVITEYFHIATMNYSTSACSGYVKDWGATEHVSLTSGCTFALTSVPAIPGGYTAWEAEIRCAVSIGGTADDEAYMQWAGNYLFMTRGAAFVSHAYSVESSYTSDAIFTNTTTPPSFSFWTVGGTQTTGNAKCALKLIPTN